MTNLIPLGHIYNTHYLLFSWSTCAILITQHRTICIIRLVFLHSNLFKICSSRYQCIRTSKIIRTISYCVILHYNVRLVKLLSRNIDNRTLRTILVSAATTTSLQHQNFLFKVLNDWGVWKITLDENYFTPNHPKTMQCDKFFIQEYYLFWHACRHNNNEWPFIDLDHSSLEYLASNILCM